MALIGAVGWGLVNFFTLHDSHSNPAYHVLNDIFPDWFWQLWFIGFGVIQLIGLRYEMPWPRAVASSALTMGFLAVFQSVLIADLNGSTPIASGVVLYLVCIFIEVCATIYQVGNIVRFKEYPRWIGSLLG